MRKDDTQIHEVFHIGKKKYIYVYILEPSVYKYLKYTHTHDFIHIKIEYHDGQLDILWYQDIMSN